MQKYDLEQFIVDCRQTIDRCQSPSKCVEGIVPLMHRLLNDDTSFLKEEHRATAEGHYARNAVHIEEGTLGIYVLVWKPGQWTPIHDHGTWGVVGVIEGTLQETSFIRTDDLGKGAKENLKLVFGNTMLLNPGTVTSFVPNPDHIHKTGNADSSNQTVISLHLYGRDMAGYHEYDIDKGVRVWKEVGHKNCQN